MKKSNVINRSDVMKLAHQIKSKNNNFSLAQHKAWVVGKVKEKMKDGLVRLTFNKKDGTTTTRLGTLQTEHVPSKRPIEQRESAPMQIIFWSLTDDGYRSFLADNLLDAKGE